MIVSVPGLILAVTVRMTVREPLRGQSEGRSRAVEAAPSVTAGFATMWRVRSLRHLAFGAALYAFVGYGSLAWVPAYLIRSFGMSTGTIGTALAFIIGIAGGLGTYFGGYAADPIDTHPGKRHFVGY